MSKAIQMVIAVSVLLFAIAPQTADAQNVSFGSGSLIIPMDVDYQDTGMLKAFGLLDKLLRANVPVNWCILPGKTVVNSATGNLGVDFTASATDFQTGTSITAHGYRGGPFVIASADAAAASSIITAWQTSNPFTRVHVATQAFTAPVRLVLTASPRIAILADGNQAILFGYLNAAGILDESNLAWTATSLDLLTPLQVAGASPSNPADGALFRPSGQPGFCTLATAHWSVFDTSLPNVVPEIQSFLQFPVHLFAECQAVNAIEGEPPTGARGKLLTSAGFQWPAPIKPTVVQFSGVGQPFAQLDGTFTPIGGSEPAFGLAAGSAYDDSGSVMVRGANVATGVQDVWMGGYYNGTCSLASLGNCTNPGPKGKVTYLGGHQYSTSVPISANPTTQGTRLFLNSLFAGSCAHAEGQPVISITAAAPATTTSATVTFTLSYSNGGPGPGLAIQLADTLPANTTFVSATGGGTFSGGTVAWNLGDLASGASGSVSVTVNLTTTGTYANQATASFAIGLTNKSASSNSTQTAYRLATATAIGSSANPSAQGQPVTFTATVTSSSGAPTGTITFKDGATTLGTAGLSATSPYQATFMTSALTSGTHGITAMYGGDATFEPSTSTLLSQNVTASFGPPAGLTATATSTTTVSVMWLPVSGADHYEVFSRSNSAPFVLRGISASTQFPDSGLTPAVTYLYEVRAVSASGVTTAFSSSDPATTIIFTNDPLAIGSTVVKAIHINELRQAVSAMRLTAALPATTFTGSISVTTTIQAIHINQLRSALSEARAAFALGSVYTDDPVVAGSTAIKSIHVQEIRDAVK